MSAIKDGGPAFPSDQMIAYNQKARGMTLRDYFAAKAVAALIAEPEWHNSDSGLCFRLNGKRCSGDAATDFAKAAYAMADAMLAAREAQT